MPAFSFSFVTSRGQETLPDERLRDFAAIFQVRAHKTLGAKSRSGAAAAPENIEVLSREALIARTLRDFIEVEDLKAKQRREFSNRLTVVEKNVKEAEVARALLQKEIDEKNALLAETESKLEEEKTLRANAITDKEMEENRRRMDKELHDASIERYEATVAALKDDLQARAEQLANARAESAKAQSELETLKGEVLKLHKAREEDAKWIEYLEDHDKKRQREFTEAEDAKNRAETDVWELRAKHKVLEMTLKAAEKEKDELYEKIENYRKELARLADSKESTPASNTDANLLSKLKNLELLCNHYRDAHEPLYKERDALAARVKQLEAEQKGLAGAAAGSGSHPEHNQASEEGKSDSDIIKSDPNLEAQINIVEDLRRQIALQEQEFETLASRLADKEAEVDGLGVENQKLKEALEAALKKARDLEEYKEAADEKYASLQEETERAHKALRVKQAASAEEKAELRRSLEVARKKLEEVSSERDRLSKALEDSQKEVARLSSQVKELTAGIEDLRKEGVIRDQRVTAIESLLEKQAAAPAKTLLATKKTDAGLPVSPLPEAMVDAAITSLSLQAGQQPSARRKVITLLEGDHGPTEGRSVLLLPKDSTAEAKGSTVHHAREEQQASTTTALATPQSPVPDAIPSLGDLERVISCIKRCPPLQSLQARVEAQLDAQRAGRLQPHQRAILSVKRLDEEKGSGVHLIIKHVMPVHGGRLEAWTGIVNRDALPSDVQEAKEFQGDDLVALTLERPIRRSRFPKHPRLAEFPRKLVKYWDDKGDIFKVFKQARAEDPVNAENAKHGSSLTVYAVPTPEAWYQLEDLLLTDTANWK